jgi:hypothetical protein
MKVNIIILALIPKTILESKPETKLSNVVLNILIGFISPKFVLVTPKSLKLINIE